MAELGLYTSDHFIGGGPAADAIDDGADQHADDHQLGACGGADVGGRTAGRVLVVEDNEFNIEVRPDAHGARGRRPGFGACGRLRAPRSGLARARGRFVVYMQHCHMFGR